MPTHKSKLTRTEDQDYRDRLARLEKMGFQVGSASPLPAEPDRIILKQILHEFGKIYELPSGAVAVVAPAKLIVPISGILPLACEMMIPWDDFPLELSDPTESIHYRKLIDEFPYHRTELLNHWLTSTTPLSRRQVEGVIVAEGWTSFPPKYHDETLVPVKLLLRDERGDEMCWPFGVRVDRGLKRQYERRQQERRERMRLTKPSAYTTGDRKSARTKEAIGTRHASSDDHAELRHPD